MKRAKKTLKGIHGEASITILQIHNANTVYPSLGLHYEYKGEFPDGEIRSLGSKENTAYPLDQVQIAAKKVGVDLEQLIQNIKAVGHACIMLGIANTEEAQKDRKGIE